MRALGAALLIGLAALSAKGASAADAGPQGPLVSPFDIAAARAVHGKARTAKPCGPPPPAVRDLTFDGFYAPGTGSSVIDEARMAAYRAGTRPIDAFEKEIIARADAYVVARPPTAADAGCALTWLATWAEGGAFLGQVSHQGGYNRKWALCVAATTYLKISAEPALEASQKNAVEDWLRRWAAVVRDDYSTHTERASKRNNHLNWALWCVAAAAAATNDREGLAWAVERYGFAIRQIAADGTLPLEVERRSKAMHYHFFAAEPLVMMAELGERNGLHLYDAEGGALHRLVGAVMQALADRSYLTNKAGYTQDFPAEPARSVIAWFEVYAARYPAAGMAPWIARTRPLRHGNSGGDLTVLFSGRSP